MKRLLNSSIAAVLLLLAVIVLLCCTFPQRTQWWMFCDVFALFMCAFTHLMALLTVKMKVAGARRKLDLISGVFGILFVVAFIVEFVILQC